MTETEKVNDDTIIRSWLLFVGTELWTKHTNTLNMNA